MDLWPFCVGFHEIFVCICTTGRFYILLLLSHFPFVFPFPFLYVSVLLFPFRFVPLLFLRRRELINPLCEGKTVGGDDRQVAGRWTAI